MVLDIARFPMGNVTRYGSDTQPIIQDTNAYEALKVGPTTVVVDDNGTHHCWYESIDQWPNPTTTVSYATSPDGRVWTKYAGNPVMSPTLAWETNTTGGGGVEAEVSPDTVLYEGGVYKLWY